ncbi:MAG: permease, partial [Alphaproteobacteria bacterium HGW-Alphaproteobacteria-11]
MTPMLAAVTALVVLVTATLSGIFGMAGGMVLMAFLVIAFPVGAAMMLHGVTQAV